MQPDQSEFMLFERLHYAAIIVGVMNDSMVYGELWLVSSLHLVLHRRWHFPLVRQRWSCFPLTSKNLLFLDLHCMLTLVIWNAIVEGVAQFPLLWIDRFLLRPTWYLIWFVAHLVEAWISIHSFQYLIGFLRPSRHLSVLFGWLDLLTHRLHQCSLLLRIEP